MSDENSDRMEMKPQNEAETPSQRFDAGVRRILSVSHDEVKRREEQWARERELAGKAKPGPKPKTSPDAHVSGSKV